MGKIWRVRFDDTLETVLAADLGTPYGVQSAWRQLVDLIGRRRVPPDPRAMAQLQAIHDLVPLGVRTAGARALELADPPAALVRLFARDELAVALPVLRTARLDASEWIELLPDLAPAGRAVLRNRRDLGPVVARALDAFGPIDFVLPDGRADIDAPAPEAVDFSFVDLVQRGPEVEPAAEESERAAPVGDEAEAPAAAPPAGPFEIADVVARIDAFWRAREEGHVEPRARITADRLRFETDAAGIIRWVDGVVRGPVIGLSLDVPGPAEGSRVDGIAAGAFRNRAGFANARLVIEGESDARGDWLISAVPVFDTASGRFTGYRGTGRRPRRDERAEPARASAAAQADSLRQLVHELRTPTNAIAGFAEMIEAQMLGPVAEPYRERAQEIRAHARELLGAIDDLDLAARLDSHALTLVADRVALRPLLAGIAHDLSPLLTLRRSAIRVPAEELSVSGDRRAVERLLARLLATLVSASGEGEQVGVRLAPGTGGMVAITIDRPRSLAEYPGESVLGIDDERDDPALLGTGFALRLARNLARELGGSLVIEPDSLTLRLPAAEIGGVEKAKLS